MSAEVWRASCHACRWRGQWHDDQDAAYREGLAHQIGEHPRVVRLEERLSDD